MTKAAAEDLCQLFHRNQGLACLVLRTSRFFPEQDDDGTVRSPYPDDNIKANEFLFRRVDLEDVVIAHLLVAERDNTRFPPIHRQRDHPFSSPRTWLEAEIRFQLSCQASSRGRRLEKLARLVGSKSYHAG